MDKASRHHMQHRAEWIAVLLGLCALAMLLVWDLYNDYQNLGKDGQERLVHNAQVAEVTLSRRLQTMANSLQAIAKDVQKRKPGRSELNERLAIMASAQTGVRTILQVARDGHIVASSRPDLIGFNYQNSERYLAISKSGDPKLLHISPPFMTPLGNYTISAGIMIEDKQGGFDGYVLAILDPDFFRVLLESVIFSDDVHASLIHGDGKVIFRLPDTEKVAGTSLANRPNSLFQRFMTSGKKTDVITGIAAATKVERMIAFARIEPLTIKADRPLVISVDRSVALMYAPWYREIQLRLILYAVIAIVSVIGLAVHQHRLRAIELLEETQDAEREANEKRIREINAELEEKVRQRTAELEKANAELRHLSRHDILTGAANRMSANEHLHSEYMRMKRSGSTYAVLMIDVDHFKRINDTYGHEAGDYVLKRVAKLLSASIRESDFLARFGGEEFIILLPFIDLKGALAVAEKIRLAIGTTPDPIAGTVTVSIGLALANPEDVDENVAVNRADNQLYEAKAGGRNRVAFEGRSA